jgi:two-component system, NarL family, sensor histidine kinase UhpB
VSRKHDSDGLGQPRLRIGAAGRTTLLYLIFGLVWILLSTTLADRFAQPGRGVFLTELIKGVAFVAFSSLLIYYLIARHVLFIEHGDREIRDREQELSMILRQLPAVVWTVDTDLVIQSTVGAGLRKLGLAENRSVGKYAGDLVPPYVISVIQRAAQGEAGEYELELNGRILHSRVEPIRALDGRVVGVVGISVDVTEEREARMELAEKRGALERLSLMLIQAQEAERERIARELHDEFGGLFTSLYFDVSYLHERAREPDVVEQRTAEMAGRIERAMQRVREVARELRPKVLDDFGLAAALEDLLGSMSKRYGIETTLSSRPEEIDVGKGLDIMLYRIVQEALTNVAKHSGATRVEVRLRRNHDEIILEVRDDGRGVRPDEIRSTSSLGILGMRERAQIMGGEMSVETYEGKGTIIRVRAPLGGAGS